MGGNGHDGVCAWVSILNYCSALVHDAQLRKNCGYCLWSLVG